MEIQVNGEPQRIAAEATLNAFIVQLGLAQERLAIELNLDIVPRPRWHETVLRQGDKLEIVHFVGGG
ncbi:MAG: sulfur carrier protein ThiS [Acidobacteria bacterium]|nr:sulfur carrier protein ThiS [Acidobacteriota bacterium]MBI3422692.1 sulfur carrier protein ThiS [Acidobacteriota bacterium]